MSPFPSDDSFDFLDLIFPDIPDEKNNGVLVLDPKKREVAEILEIKLDDKIKF